MECSQDQELKNASSVQLGSTATTQIKLALVLVRFAEQANGAQHLRRRANLAKRENIYLIMATISLHMIQYLTV